jgi:hypothetical protein|tara:strand:- start:1351 stop:1662 length:312 start_codon:yes stop_codon:yes gene_type:complete
MKMRQKSQTRQTGGDKAEVIHRREPWKTLEAVELGTLEWVDWFSNRRLMEPIGNGPPAEAEQRYYAMQNDQTLAAKFFTSSLRQSRGGSYHEGTKVLAKWYKP